MDVVWKGGDFMKHSVNSISHHKKMFSRLKMNIAGPLDHRLVDKVIDHIHDRKI